MARVHEGARHRPAGGCGAPLFWGGGSLRCAMASRARRATSIISRRSREAWRATSEARRPGQRAGPRSRAASPARDHCEPAWRSRSSPATAQSTARMSPAWPAPFRSTQSSCASATRRNCDRSSSGTSPVTTRRSHSHNRRHGLAPADAERQPGQSLKACPASTRGVLHRGSYLWPESAMTRWTPWDTVGRTRQVAPQQEGRTAGRAP